jgi:hypothetical protein
MNSDEAQQQNNEWQRSEEMEHRSDMSESISEIAEALAKAQSEMTFAHKDSNNPFFKSNYADLNSVLDAVRGPLSKNGIAIVQTTDGDSGSITVITKLIHKSGEWLEGRLTMTPEKKGAQAFGAVLTYSRRYALAAIAGVAQADDDAEAATAHKAAPDVLPAKVWSDAESEAKKGTQALQSWFTGLPRPKKEVISQDGKRWDKIKGQAADFDAAKE